MGAGSSAGGASVVPPGSGAVLDPPGSVVDPPGSVVDPPGSVVDPPGSDVDVPDVDAGLVVEFDSWEFHSDREAFERDRHKQNLLSALGLRVVRITWTMLTTDPAGVVRAIRDALAVAPAQAC